MNFTVSARLSARRFAYQHASVLNALDQGMSLVAAGLSDVMITDGDGRVRTPAALYQTLFAAGCAGPNPLRSAAGQAQAA